MLLEKIKQTIFTYQLIKPGEKIILGLSGGHDSAALLDILYRLKSKIHFKLVLAHVNYGYRGRDSDGDEKFVRKLATKYKLRIYVKKLQVTPGTTPKLRRGAGGKASYPRYHPEVTSGGTGQGKLQSVNLEDFFRKIRYQFFEEVLNKEKAQKIALAHTLNDQAETILMFFLRGSGLTGLSGMDYQRNNITRPLLDVSRAEITQYLKENKLKWRQDITNEDISFTRNKIRHKLIPFLEKEFNPNLKNTLKMTAEIFRENNEALSNVTETILLPMVKKKNSKLLINLKKFLKLQKAFKRLLVLRILADLNVDTKKISFVFLEEILKMIEKSRVGAIKKVGDLQILKKSDKIIIEKTRIKH